MPAAPALTGRGTSRATGMHVDATLVSPLAALGTIIRYLLIGLFMVLSMLALLRVVDVGSRALMRRCVRRVGDGASKTRQR